MIWARLVVAEYIWDSSTGRGDIGLMGECVPMLSPRTGRERRRGHTPRAGWYRDETTSSHRLRKEPSCAVCYASMHDRKAQMEELSDGFVVLPGEVEVPLRSFWRILTSGPARDWTRKPCGLLIRGRLLRHPTAVSRCRLSRRSCVNAGEPGPRDRRRKCCGYFSTGFERLRSPGNRNGRIRRRP